MPLQSRDYLRWLLEMFVKTRAKISTTKIILCRCLSDSMILLFLCRRISPDGRLLIWWSIVVSNAHQTSMSKVSVASSKVRFGMLAGVSDGKTSTGLEKNVVPREKVPKEQIHYKGANSPASLCGLRHRSMPAVRGAHAQRCYTHCLTMSFSSPEETARHVFLDNYDSRDESPYTIRPGLSHPGPRDEILHVK